MSIPFFYNLEDDTFTLEAYKATVTLYWENGTVSTIDVNGYEFTPYEDTLYGLSVSLGMFPHQEHYSLNQIKEEAISQYEALRAEAEEEAECELKMAEELSSPYLTGRV